MNSYFFKITEEERADILRKQKDVYNGFTRVQHTENTQPLYVEDMAKDKTGFELKNSDLAEESECMECGTMESSCPECGGSMNENMCEACGYKSTDISDKNEFDYTEETVNESISRIKNFMNRLNII